VLSLSAQLLLNRRLPLLSKPSSQPLIELPPRNSTSLLLLKLRSPFMLQTFLTSMRKRMLSKTPSQRKNQMCQATLLLARSPPMMTRNHLLSPFIPPLLQLALPPRILPSLKRASLRKMVPNLTLLAPLLLLRVLRKSILQLLPQLLQRLRMLKLSPQ